jgi:plastocyanin
MRSFLAIAAISAIVTHAALAATSVTVLQQSKKFSSTELVIAKGDTLVFKNDDPFAHNVYSQSSGISFELKVQQPGESSTVVFEREGTGTVLCAIHPQMKLKLTVK